MQKIIREHLAKIEEAHNVEILYACEAGSRAWGFASTDSDYDVRFIYRRKKAKDYISLRKLRDSLDSTNFNYLSRDPLLDFAGWDITKALGLAYKGNAVLQEWMNSPTRYKITPFSRMIKRTIEAEPFDVNAAFYHYKHLAKFDYCALDQEHKLKRLMYSFRATLCTIYVRHYRKAPPVDTAELAQAMLYVLDNPEAVMNPAEKVYKYLLERKTFYTEARKIYLHQIFWYFWLKETYDYMETLTVEPKNYEDTLITDRLRLDSFEALLKRLIKN